MSKKYVIEYFHPNRQALQEEVRNHPELVQQLADLEPGTPETEFETRLAAVATYCNVLLDGDYLQSDLDEICGHLVQKLRAKRIAVFVPTDAL